MYLNSLGNANFSNRQNTDVASKDLGDSDETSGSATSSRNEVSDSASTLISPPSLVEEVVEESNIVQNNGGSGSEKGERGTGSKIDLTI